jgi:hypothetical protein
MGFLVGVIGLAVGAVGFWLNFELNPIPVSAEPLDSGYFDLGATGVLVATLGFMTEIVAYAVRRAPGARFSAPRARAALRRVRNFGRSGQRPAGIA